MDCENFDDTADSKMDDGQRYWRIILIKHSIKDTNSTISQ